MTQFSKISPCLWFNGRAEEAARFYVSLFDDSGIESIVRYCKIGFEHHGQPEGTVMTVAFRLAGQTFTALNGGPQFSFSEAISFQVLCDTQDEIDRLWSALSQNGGSEGPCGWLKDRFGLSWQIVPSALPRFMTDPEPAKVARVTQSFLKMRKLDAATIERAYRGE